MILQSEIFEENDRNVLLREILWTNQFLLLVSVLVSKLYIAAVRFGRVPKREKARMAEEMARATELAVANAMYKEVEDAEKVVQRCHEGFMTLVQAVQHLIDKTPTQCCCPLKRCFHPPSTPLCVFTMMWLNCTLVVKVAAIFCMSG